MTGYLGPVSAGGDRTSRNAKSPAARGFSDAGGGTRTPDTRIMMLRRFGSVEPNAAGGGLERGHIRAVRVSPEGGLVVGS